MLSMVKPLYAPEKQYKVIEHQLHGNTLDEKLNSMKKGRTVVATMALSLYDLEDTHKRSLLDALGVKVKGNSVRGLKTPKHVTTTNMKLLLYNYAKQIAKKCEDNIYKGILEQYSEITTDTNLCSSTLKEYADYMSILVSWFGVPELFHTVKTLKLEDDGTYTVTFNDASDFLTKEELEQKAYEKETEIERLKSELAEAEEAKRLAEEELDKTKEDNAKLEKLAKANLFGTEDPLAVRVEITYSSSYQIGVGADSPADKFPILPELMVTTPLFKDALNDLCKSKQGDVIELLANLLPQGGSLDVKASYRCPDYENGMHKLAEQIKEVLCSTPSQELDDK